MSITGIIVEDGSRVAGANSYVTVAELIQFGKNRQHTFSTSAAVLLIMAMDYIDNLAFKGIKYEQDQALQWPRIGVFIDGYSLDSDVIPKELKNGLMQAALSIDSGNSPLAVVNASVKRRKVGELEIEYRDNAVNNPVDPKINFMLKKLLENGGGGRFSVSKA